MKRCARASDEELPSLLKPNPNTNTKKNTHAHAHTTNHTGAAAALAAAQQLPPPATCGADVLSRFDPSRLDAPHNAFAMALLASDAYPAGVLGAEGATNAKYSVARYEEALRARWLALGARSIEAVDDAQAHLEAHALVAATATDVFVSFRGTSTTAGWTNNARLSPWKIVGSKGGSFGADKPLQVHGGFAMSFAAIYPKVRSAIARALQTAVADPSRAKVYVSGHSLGGAHATLLALALDDSGLKVGGVWTVRKGER